MRDVLLGCVLANESPLVTSETVREQMLWNSRLSAIATPGTAPPTARPTGPDRAQVEGFFVPEMISGVRMCSGRTARA